MDDKIQLLIDSFANSENEEVYQNADQLAAIGTKEVLVAMLPLLENEESAIRYLAGRTLMQMKENDGALEAIFNLLDNKGYVGSKSELLEILEGFDISSKFVPIFKQYLFGSFKVSAMAKNLLDYKEFVLTPRVLKKCEKHWQHYQNNVKQDEVFEVKKIEVNEIIIEIRNNIQ